MSVIWRDCGAGGHGRNKDISRFDTECDVCGKDRMCLSFDSSDEEYYAICICEECASLAFQDGKLVRTSPRASAEKGGSDG